MTTPADSTPLDQAFAALESYGLGSSRAVLHAIDQAVVAALPDANRRASLETRLIAALARPLSTVAIEYVCHQLRLVGTAAAVPALAALLSKPQSSHPARIALEALPPPEPARALRDALGGTAGVLKLGVIESLGRLRDSAAVGTLRPLLADPDPAVAGAAAAALGRIGSIESAEALREFLPKAPDTVRPALADAALVCVERLKESGRPDDARQLCTLLDDPRQPAHVRQAAVRAAS